MFCQSSCQQPQLMVLAQKISATSLISDSKFLVVGKICMRRSVSSGNMFVIFRFLIFIINHKTNRSSCRFPLKSSRKKLYGITFFSLGNDGTFTRLSAVKLMLNFFKINFNSCWKIGDDSTIKLFRESLRQGRKREKISVNLFIKAKLMKRYESCELCSCEIFETYNTRIT